MGRMDTCFPVKVINLELSFKIHSKIIKCLAYVAGTVELKPSLLFNLK